MSESAIINFFTEKTVFLTGGTGFLGKVLVEKLLRTCKIKKLYLLVRSKKGKSVEDRFMEYLRFPCFKTIREHTVLIQEKLVFVNGDLEQTNLGINKVIEKMLIEETNIVIHAGANVKFNQPLREAAIVNVEGTVNVLNLVKKMTQLESFIYVSTAYSNCPRDTIDEKCYPPPMTPRNLFSLLDMVTDDTDLEKMTPILLKEWPNTYSFTKSIAEDYINSEGRGLPIAIVRPSVVISTAKEPFPGWVDNFYGPMGIMAAAALGVVRSFNADPECIANFVPCDYVSNFVLSVAWDVANNKSDSVEVYNFSVEDKNSVTIGQFVEIVTKIGFTIPPKRAIWWFTCKIRKNETFHKICVFLFHTVLAYLADFILMCIGRQQLAVENYNKLNKIIELTTFFTKRNWNFINNNRRILLSKLSDKDKELFNFNMDSLDLVLLFEDLLKGGRIYLLKDPLETVPEALKKYQILKVVHYVSLAVFYFVLYKLISLVLSLFI